MLASHLDGIPSDIDEAARVDDTTALAALFRVVSLRRGRVWLRLKCIRS
jgi:ABC-type maltose transport system permease subunit